MAAAKLVLVVLSVMCGIVLIAVAYGIASEILRPRREFIPYRKPPTRRAAK